MNRAWRTLCSPLPFGLFGRQKIKAMIGRKLIQAETPVEPSQLQPASLRLEAQQGSLSRARQLPAGARALRSRAARSSLNAEPVSLAGKGSRLGKGDRLCRALLMERLELRPNLSGAANPKSLDPGASTFSPASSSIAARRSTRSRSTTRASFGSEISPCSFSVRVKAGTKLNRGPVPQPQFPATRQAHLHAR